MYIRNQDATDKIDVIDIMNIIIVKDSVNDVV